MADRFYLYKQQKDERQMTILLHDSAKKDIVKCKINLRSGNQSKSALATFDEFWDTPSSGQSL